MNTTLITVALMIVSWQLLLRVNYILTVCKLRTQDNANLNMKWSFLKQYILPLLIIILKYLIVNYLHGHYLQCLICFSSSVVYKVCGSLQILSGQFIN